MSELNNAIKQVADGYTIRLTQDISSAGTLNVDADNMMKETTTITIDVSNYTLSAYSIIVGTGKTLTMTASGGSYSGRLNANGGTVNLPTGMKLTNTVTNLYVRNGGTANVTGASIECSATTLGHAVEVAKGTLNLSAGSIKVTKDDVKIAKNYLSELELKRLNLLVSEFLDFAEFQALEEKPMKMQA